MVRQEEQLIRHTASEQTARGECSSRCSALPPAPSSTKRGRSHPAGAGDSRATSQGHHPGPPAGQRAPSRAIPARQSPRTPHGPEAHSAEPYLEEGSILLAVVVLLAGVLPGDAEDALLVVLPHQPRVLAAVYLVNQPLAELPVAAAHRVHPALAGLQVHATRVRGRVGGFWGALAEPASPRTPTRRLSGGCR